MQTERCSRRDPTRKGRLVTLLVVPLVIATVVSLLAPLHWVADVVANGRLQLIVTSVMVAAICLCFRRVRPFGFAIGCLLLHLGLAFISSTIRTGPERDRTHSLHVMTLNVLTDNRRHDAVAEEIRTVDPDVFALLEVDDKWESQIRESLSLVYPHSLVRSQNLGNFGIAVFSKFPITESEVFRLNEPIDSLEIVVQGVRVIATHPLPPIGQANFHARNQHLRELAARIRLQREADAGQPVVVMGDLNVAPWSPIFRGFERQSSLRRAQVGLELEPTWHIAGGNFFSGLMLDHVLVSDEIECEAYRVGPDVGSDHRSVSVRLRY